MSRKVYVAIVGWHYEGSEIIGVAATKKTAKKMLDNAHGSYDWREIEIYTLGKAQIR